MKKLIFVFIALVYSFQGQSQTIAEAKALYEEEMWEASIKLLNQLSPTNDQLLYLGKNMVMLKKYDEAIDYLKTLTRNEPNNAEYQYQCGRAYLAKLQEATSFADKSILASKTKQYFEKAVALDDKHIPAKISLANYYANAPAIAGGSHSKALKLAEDIRPVDPASSYNLQYNLHYTKKDYLNAMKALESLLIISEGKDKHEIYFRMAALNQEYEKYEDAFNNLKIILQLEPDHYRAKYQFARTAVLSKQHIDAGVKYLQDYIDAGPYKDYFTDDSAYWRLGNLYELQGKKDEAVRLYERALDINPQNEQVKKSLQELAL